VIILVFNSGSSSLKYTLLNMADETILFSGVADRIGMSGSSYEFSSGAGIGGTITEPIADHGAALDKVLAMLAAGPLSSLRDLSCVAHRVGHGGKYRAATFVDQDVIDEIRRMTPMVPLHHPAMVREIEECRRRMPDTPHIAVFDTWFHESLPDKAAIYGLPYEYFEELGYRRTGFHGNSHAYVSAEAARFVGRPIEELKIISCHLGNGASVCAVKHGVSVDTSLGMTALEGLIMGTRSGDVDPGLIPIIMKEKGLSPDDMVNLLYRDSGLKGISGISRDMRDIEKAAAEGNRRAALALDAFCHRVTRYIGAMLTVLGSCDILVFTGGIGVNSPTVRRKCLEGTEPLGFVLDSERNLAVAPSGPPYSARVSVDSSAVTVLAVETYEEIMIARQCAALLAASPKGTNTA
jgi:acetate kinase